MYKASCYEKIIGNLENIVIIVLSKHFSLVQRTYRVDYYIGMYASCDRTM
jgi:hypothetical protein